MHLPPVLSVLRRPRDPKACRCGHWREAHAHYRSGTDCALCACPRFRAAGRSTRPPPEKPGQQGFYGELRLVA